jgi:type IV pilus assembly protein PilW
MKVFSSMVKAKINIIRAQSGMSLIELLVGILIGLIATLAISNLFSGFESRKRMISGSADAQSSGVLALYYIQRDAQNAGYGLPLYNSGDPSPLLCPINTSINQDGVVINLSPIVIVDGGAGSDVLRIRYGNPASGGASVRATGNMAAPELVGQLIGCRVNDVVLFHQDPDNLRCSLARIQGLKANRTIDALSEVNTAPTESPVSDLNGAEWVRFSCLGTWNQYEYTVNASQELTRTGGTPGTIPFPSSAAVPVVSDIVAFQAQYGVTNTLEPTAAAAAVAAVPVAPTAEDYLNRVDQWTDATGNFGPGIDLLDRNRIRAIRVAVVVRDSNLQQNNVSQQCNGDLPGISRVCIWQGDAAPANVNLGHIPHWQRYRYRTFEVVVPLRNITWNRDAL